MKQVKINGRWTLNLPDYRQGQWSRPWEVERLEAMHKNIRADDIIFEAGAECGDMSALFASWAAGIVIAEPSEIIFPNIRASFEANGLSDKMLSAFVGFFDDHTDPGSLEIEQGNPWPPCSRGEMITDHCFANVCERPDIPRITIDDMAIKTGVVPNVITIDTEGSELRVLRGAVNTLKTARPIVFVSVHAAFMIEMYGDSPQDLVQFMVECGYESHFICHDHEAHFLYLPKEQELFCGVVQR